MKSPWKKIECLPKRHDGLEIIVWGLAVSWAHLGMGSANETLIGWAHTHNDPFVSWDLG